MSITNDNGIAPAIYRSAMNIHKKTSLHASGCGSTRLVDPQSDACSDVFYGYSSQIYKL